MNSIIKWIIAKGYGQEWLAIAMRKGLTIVGTALSGYLIEKGVSPDTAGGVALYIAGFAPIIVSALWSWLEKRYGVKVVEAAITSDPVEVKTVADVQEIIKNGGKI
jgi:hypothetical protein